LTTTIDEMPSYQNQTTRPPPPEQHHLAGLEQVDGRKRWNAPGPASPVRKRTGRRPELDSHPPMIGANSQHLARILSHCPGPVQARSP
jgi:hypothetical protein